MARGLTPNEYQCLKEQVEKVKKKCKIPDHIKIMTYDSNATLAQLISQLISDFETGRINK